MPDELTSLVADAIAEVDRSETTGLHNVMAEAAIAVILEEDGDAQEEDANPWRDLALQFDGNRIEARSILKAVAEGQDMREMAAAFLARPPLSGEEVLAQRIAKLASSTPEGTG